MSSKAACLATEPCSQSYKTNSRGSGLAQEPGMQIQLQHSQQEAGSQAKLISYYFHIQTFIWAVLLQVPGQGDGKQDRVHHKYEGAQQVLGNDRQIPTTHRETGYLCFLVNASSPIHHCCASSRKVRRVASGRRTRTIQATG